MATMKILLLVFVISSAAALVGPSPRISVEIFSQETYTETRDITDSAGTTFSCLYTIVYDPSRKVFQNRCSCIYHPSNHAKFISFQKMVSKHIFNPFCPARLSTGGRALCNATQTPTENKQLRTSSLRSVKFIAPVHSLQFLIKTKEKIDSFQPVVPCRRPG